MVYTTPFKALVYREKPSNFKPVLEVAACYCECRGKYLFLKRSIGSSQENTWGVPAGKFEKGETAYEAVSRETFEEVGINLDEDKLDSLGKVYIRYQHVDFVYHMFHQEFSDFPSITLSDEHQDYCWTTLEEIEQLPLISGGKETLYQFLALCKKPKIERKEFYFVRHGQTEANVNPNFKNIDEDIPLNVRGLAQSFSLRSAIASIPLNTVCFSPAQRVKETKKIITSGLDLENHEMDGLGECRSDIWAKMVQLEKGSDYRVCENVERFLSGAINGINTALEKDGPTLVVSHGGVHWALCYFLMIENHPWKINNCQLVHFCPVGEDQWEAKIKTLESFSKN